jgi:IS30 family transposase
MADRADISPALGMSAIFCDPASPWQRGTNENTNGLLLPILPKALTCRSKPQAPGGAFRRSSTTAR